jgi:nucleotide-binding universal stress UspA family protein
VAGSSALQTILVALDGTPHSERTLPLAGTLSRATDARLRLLRVVPVESGSENQGAADQLRRLAAGLGTLPGLVVETAIRQGDPFAEIVAEIFATKADLVIISSHGGRGLQHTPLGGTARRLLQQSPVPVLIQPPYSTAVTAIRNVLVLLDGSPGGALAMGTAALLARAAHAGITLLHVVVPLAFLLARTGADASMPLTYYDPGWDEDLLRSAHTYVNGLATRLRRIGINAVAHVSEGQDVVATIVDTARHLDPDIIVMSTDAHAGAVRAVVGSVAHGVVRRTGHAVLLVRQPTTADMDEPPTACI